jgi:hypothetical protein
MVRNHIEDIGVFDIMILQTDLKEFADKVFSPFIWFRLKPTYLTNLSNPKKRGQFLDYLRKC